MSSYEEIRRRYLPETIRILLIAESPPPSAKAGGSRHFYRSEKTSPDDRLFINTIKALYPQAAELSWSELGQNKEVWLRKFQSDGWYMIESLDKSLRHSVSKKERQARIREALPRLLERVRELIHPDAKIILIKSNVFEVAAEPLRQAGFTVLNTELLDYPGQFNQRAYREKLAALAAKT